MLYLFQNKVYLMKGTEKVSEVVQFTKNIKGKQAGDYLLYLYFTYHKQKSPWITLPIAQRRDFVIQHYKLFDSDSSISETFAEETESNVYFGLLKEFFVNLTYTSLERDAMTYDAKVEHYRVLLSMPTNEAEKDIELDKALRIFRNARIEVEGLIATENESEEKDGRHHLFEIPDEQMEGISVNGLFI